MSKLGSTIPATLDDNQLESIEAMRLLYTSNEINDMPFWLEEQKKNDNVPVHYNNIFDYSKLNERQNVAFEIVSYHFNNKILLPLNIIITGQGGSGKSFIINALRCFLGHHCIVSAFFGIAAFNINGITLHQLLRLPIRGKNHADLKGQALANLQLRLKNVKYLIIDEFSVIGQRMLGWIDRRCRQATGKLDETFGGISVILVGDIAQLPPVSDKPLYHTLPDDSTALMGYCAYHKFNTVVKLVENQRVTDISQLQFKKLLLNLRNGESTVDDWQVLLSRNAQRVHSASWNNAITLTFGNDKVASHNIQMLKQLKEVIFPVKAKHNTSKGATISVDEFGGLQPLIHISVGVRVMLTRNLWVEKGLCNGAMGYVKHIIYKEGDQPPSLPVAVLVKFYYYDGPSFGTSEEAIPIIPLIANATTFEDNIERQQLPLKLCWAITIHKSQGLTLDKAVVDLGLQEKVAGLAYVAVSRVRKLEDILLEPMSYERLLAVKKSANFIYRVQEEKRIDILAVNTLSAYTYNI